MKDATSQLSERGEGGGDLGWIQAHPGKIMVAIGNDGFDYWNDGRMKSGKWRAK
jgi:hypothetical protein